VYIYLKLAWRNMLRNKRRSLLAGIAIGVGLASLMLTDAVILGMEESMLQSATDSFMGEAQIHREGFRESLEVEETVVDPEAVLAALTADSLVRHFTPRTLSLAMISSPANMSTVTLVGVDPRTERHLSEVDEALIEGDYLDPEQSGNLVIGRKLAELLEVELGDRIVITVAQAHTGDLSQELFRVSGIYDFNVDELDRAMAFIHIGKAQTMLGLPGEFHQVAISFVDRHYAGQLDLYFWDRFSQGGNEAAGWRVLMPEMAAAFELTSFSTLIMGLILFGIVSLGIMNTLFMSMYDRMFEFGVMRAVGTRPLAMGRLVLFEACALALVGAVLGALIGWISIEIFTWTGLDYSGVEFAGATMREPMIPILRGQQFTMYPVLVFVVTALVGIYPAAYAARLVPAQAMRKSF
jgi:ABC-type lipoprotein release transport system permease subunit